VASVQTDTAAKRLADECSVARAATARECVACEGRVGVAPYFRNTEIALFQCEVCGSLTALPRPSPAQQAALHDNAEYFHHPYFEHRRRRPDAVERRCRATFAKIGAAIDLGSLRGQTHPDVGCDTGDFVLAAARIFGTVPVGIDIAQRSVEESARQGVDAHCCSLEHAPTSLVGLTVVTAIDLLEHVVDPGGFLVDVKNRLRPGGAVYIETPNMASHVYSLGRALWRATGGPPAALLQRLFPSEHVQYFSGAGLAKAATNAGLEVVSLGTRPLPSADVGASAALRVAMSAIQTLDSASGKGILLCMVARRPC
jgi:SAM-dependent methyltransferase